MKKRNLARITLGRDQVMHYSTSKQCFICGKPSDHAVRPHDKTEWVDFCTEHLARIFKTPSNRFPKKKRNHSIIKPAAIGEVRNFILKHHMSEPFYFKGSREIYYEEKIRNSQWFFSLYHDIEDDCDVVSITKVFRSSEGKASISFVETVGSEGVAATVATLLNKHDRAMTQLPSEKVTIEVAATKFLTKVFG